MEEPHWFWGHLKSHPGANEQGLLKDVEWTEKQPRFHSWYFGILRPILVVCHPDTVKQILKTSEPKCTSGGGGYKLLIPWIGDGLLLSKGKKWSRNRRLLTPAFHFDVLKPYVKIYNECTRKLMKKFENGSANGKSVEIFQPVSLCTLDVILRCAFSYDGETQEETIGEEVHGKKSYVQTVVAIAKLIVERAFQPIWYIDWIYSCTKSGKTFKEHCEVSHKKADEVIHQRQKTLKEKGEQITANRYVDFLDILLLAKDENGVGLTDVEIREEVETFMFEGHDTTASGISWALYNLAKNQDYQAKAREEVDNIIKDKEEVSWEDLPEMEYLTMCIKESLRLNPTVFVISRELTNSQTIDGHSFPPGTLVDIGIYALHHNETVWGKDHMIYHPDRFHKDNMVKMDSHAFVPFSAGPRNCIGQNFAMNEMKCTIASILHKFELSVDNSHKVEMVPEIILKAKNGIKLYFKKRKV